MIKTLDEIAKGVSTDKEMKSSPGVLQREEEDEEPARRLRRNSQ